MTYLHIVFGLALIYYLGTLLVGSLLTVELNRVTRLNNPKAIPELVCFVELKTIFKVVIFTALYRLMTAHYEYIQIHPIYDFVSGSMYSASLAIYFLSLFLMINAINGPKSDKPLTDKQFKRFQLSMVGFTVGSIGVYMLDNIITTVLLIKHVLT